MKNIKWNDQLINRIISGGLSIVLVTTGYCLGKSNTEKIVTQALDDYIEQQESLEKEIEELTIEKEKLLNDKEQLRNTRYFDYSNLVVIESLDENNQSNLYICEGGFDNPFLREYHNEFSVIYKMPNYEWATKTFPDYTQVDNYKGIISFLTDEELRKVVVNKGMITDYELDEILVRIREDYNNKKIIKKIK